MAIGRRLWLPNLIPCLSPPVSSRLRSHVFKFSIPRIDEAIRPFKATLTWTDPYSSATSGSPVLHDLDITVTSDLKGTLTYPNGRSDRDTFNTVGPQPQRSP